MATILFPYGIDNNQKTFKVSNAAIKFNSPVELDTGTAGRIKISTNWSNAIGHIVPDDVYEATNGTTMIAVGDFAYVALKGPVINMTCGTTVTRGDKVSLDSNSKVTGLMISSGSSNHHVGIALESGVLNGVIQVMRL